MGRKISKRFKERIDYLFDKYITDNPALTPKRLIGDVHGKLEELEEIETKNFLCTEIGFKEEHKRFKWRYGVNQEVLFGNHDYYPEIGAVHSATTTWRYYKAYDLFVIRGAYSIDRNRRTEGIDWFPEEELSEKECEEVFEAYQEIKPKVVFSHDVPHFWKQKKWGYNNPTVTGSLLDKCFFSDPPEKWIHGHYHFQYEEKYYREGELVTTFIGLEELGYFDLHKVLDEENTLLLGEYLVKNSSLIDEEVDSDRLDYILSFLKGQRGNESGITQIKEKYKKQKDED